MVDLPSSDLAEVQIRGGFAGLNHRIRFHADGSADIYVQHLNYPKTTLSPEQMQQLQSILARSASTSKTNSVFSNIMDSTIIIADRQYTYMAVQTNGKTRVINDSDLYQLAYQLIVQSINNPSPDSN